jgi:hypothetical protein
MWLSTARIWETQPTQTQPANPTKLKPHADTPSRNSQRPNQYSKKIEAPTKWPKTAQSSTKRHKTAQTGTFWPNLAHFGTKRHKRAQSGTKRHKLAQTGPKRHKVAQSGTFWPKSYTSSCRGLSCLPLRCPVDGCDSARLTAGKSQRLPIKHDIRPTSCGCCRLRAVLGWHGSHSARFSGSLWVTVSRRLRLWLQCRWLADECHA